MNERIDEALLDRYLAGECTPEERARVDRWSAHRTENAEALQGLRDGAAPPDDSGWDVDAAWARLSNRIADDRPVPAPRLLRSRRQAAAPPVRRFPALLLRAAAVVIVALGVTTVWRALSGPGGELGRAALDDYSAPVGSTRVVQLADGSQVTLGPTSRLRVPRDATAERDVLLEGQAFFRVTHDPDRPFRVLSDGNAVTVLGTEFDVRTARPGEPLRVVVATGRVSLGREDREPAAVLEAGQMALLSAQGTAQVGPADLDRLLGWTRGRIEIDELPLADALVELERWYDVELQLADAALAARRVSASFRGGEPLEQVLEALTVALGARFQREGRVYRLVPDGAPR